MAMTRRQFLRDAVAVGAAAGVGTRLWQLPKVVGQDVRRVRIKHAFIFPNTTLWGYNETLWTQFAKDLGVDVETQPVSNVPAMRAAFARGDFDLVSVDPIETLNIQLNQGGRPRVIATNQPKNEYVIIVHGERIPTLREVAGKRLAISSPGATPVVIMQLAFARKGIDLNKAGVQLLPVGGSSARAQALLAGRVDGTAVYHDDAYHLMAAEPKLKILIDTADAVPLIFTSLQGREAFLDAAENRDGIVRALVARGRMLKWIVENKWKYLEGFARQYPAANPRVLSPVHDFYVKVGQFDPDLTTDPREYTKTMDVYAKEANPPLAQGTLPVERWVDASFRDEALRRLGGRGWWRK